MKKESSNKNNQGSSLKNTFTLLFILVIFLLFGTGGIVPGVIIFGFILYKTYFKPQKYKKKVRDLYADIMYKQQEIESYQLFDIDKKELLSKINNLLQITQTKIANLDKTIMDSQNSYETILKEFEIIDKELLESSRKYAEKNNLVQDIHDFKKINL